jgi:ribonuclease HI
LLRFGTVEREISGYVAQTTNNRMELMAALEALRALKRPCRVRLKTDSQYVQKGMTLWGYAWARKGWRKKANSAELIPNADLWQALWEAAGRHSIDWVWVRGHAGDCDNERVDALARQAIVQHAMTS